MGNTMDSAPDSSFKAAVIRDRESPDSLGLCPWSIWLKNLEDFYLSTLCTSEFPAMEMLVRRESPHLLNTQGRSGGEELANWTALFRNLISSENFFPSLVYSALQPCHVINPAGTPWFCTIWTRLRKKAMMETLSTH